MSTLTPNLGLFKYDPSNDGKEVFSITNALNNNWDILDNVMSSTSSLGESGYMKFNNGLIINYGQASVSSQENQWQQPLLTEYGNVGGNNFACSVSGEANNYHGWMTFDGIMDGRNANGWEYYPPAHLIFYNPTPIKVSKLTITNFYNGYYLGSGSVEGSNDNISWESICNWTCNNQNPRDFWDITVNSQKYYKYYKLIVTESTSQVYFVIGEIQIDAVYLTSAANSITFPCAFTTTNYAYSLAYRNGKFGDSYATTLTTTGMTLQNNSNADAVYYIAVGY